MTMNIYYGPEKFGLKTVGEVEFSSGSYEFDLTVVWHDPATGKVFYAEDSGCSCPSPFESTGRNDLVEIKRTQDIIDHLRSRAEAASSWGPDTTAERAALIEKVRAVKGKKG